MSLIFAAFMLPITIIINVLLVIHVLVSLLMILIVLMQRPKNEGLGAAFGGGMTDNLFGAQTTNVLQTITRWLGGMFFVLTLGLSILYVKQGSSRSAVQEKLSNAPVPAATPALPTPESEVGAALPAEESLEANTPKQNAVTPPVNKPDASAGTEKSASPPPTKSDANESGPLPAEGKTKPTPEGAATRQTKDSPPGQQKPEGDQGKKSPPPPPQ